MAQLSNFAWLSFFIDSLLFVSKSPGGKEAKTETSANSKLSAG